MLQCFRFRWRLVLRFLLLAAFGLVVKRVWLTPQNLPNHLMPSTPTPSEVASSLLATKGLRLQSVDVLQSLWAGYGQICRIVATPDPSPDSLGTSSTTGSTASTELSTPQDTQSYIIKLITPPPTTTIDEGHIRKILSYQVEQYFYTHLAPQLPASIPVAKYLASMNEQHPDGTVSTAMILSDLKQDYPIAGEKRDVLNPTQVHAALDWLSSFHGFWWPRVKQFDRHSLVRPPLREAMHDEDARNKTVWLNGGYTYLATRRAEYENLAKNHDAEWNEPLTDWESDEFSISDLVADVLAPKLTGWSPTQDYMTLIHGDVKSENLFTTKNGEEVVFYDFQYTGLGLGVCDLAKLFTCSIPPKMLVDQPTLPRELSMQPGEKKLLKRYWTRLQEKTGRVYDWDVFVGHWETALIDWLRFQASWGFWGNTKWLEARARSILKNETWKNAVAGNAKMAGLWEQADEGLDEEN
jgi:thiamine kinase-like enzyme